MPEPWLKNLNSAQLEAVQHGDGPLLVIAGAGTGKTMTLASRVASLLHRGVPPGRILLLTFTRRAAAEMVRRAGNLSGADHTQQVWGGTFHATANRLLRIYAPTIGLTPDFTVLDQADAADVMNLVRVELGLGKPKKRFARKETLVAIYSRMVSARDKLSEVLKRHFPWCTESIEDIRRIFERYTDLKREQNVLDYDDLLIYWNELAAVHPAVGDRFDHILVDEYQDTNAVQAEILLGMRASNDNICVVGDDAQSIYSFRAATIRNILDFPDEFPGTTVVKLEQNYRSTKPILAASNAVMSHARQRYTKELWSDRDSRQRPLLIHCMDEAAQCIAVCENILARLEQGTPLKKQAVLFRAGHHSDQLEVELARRNIPFHKFGGLKFIESAHVKDLLAFLRILENPNDEISWMRVLLLMDGIGPASARRIVRELRHGKRPAESETVADDVATAGIRTPLRRLIEKPPRVPPAAADQFDGLREMLGKCLAFPGSQDEGEDAVHAAAPTVAVQVEMARTFYEPIFQRRYDNAIMRLRDLEQLEQVAAGYRSRRQFLNDLTLDPPSATSDLAQPPYLDEDYLVLSTIHSAKGCEWDVVHIIHAADGMIPSDMAVSDDDGVEEERRLLYVAMTRAKDILYVYFPLRYYQTRYRRGDAHQYAQLSRFLLADVRTLFEERAHGLFETEDEMSPHRGARRNPRRFITDLLDD